MAARPTPSSIHLPMGATHCPNRSWALLGTRLWRSDVGDHDENGAESVFESLTKSLSIAQWIALQIAQRRVHPADSDFHDGVKHILLDVDERYGAIHGDSDALKATLRSSALKKKF